MLGLTFVNPVDYEKIRQDDFITILNIYAFAPDINLKIALIHSDGTSEMIEAKHTYNRQQIEWFKAGSALNKIREEIKR